MKVLKNTQKIPTSIKPITKTSLKIDRVYNIIILTWNNGMKNHYWISTKNVNDQPLKIKMINNSFINLPVPPIISS